MTSGKTDQLDREVQDHIRSDMHPVDSEQSDMLQDMFALVAPSVIQMESEGGVDPDAEEEYEEEDNKDYSEEPSDLEEMTEEEWIAQNPHPVMSVKSTKPRDSTNSKKRKTIKKVSNYTPVKRTASTRSLNMGIAQEKAKRKVKKARKN